MEPLDSHPQHTSIGRFWFPVLLTLLDVIRVVIVKPESATSNPLLQPFFGSTSSDIPDPVYFQCAITYCDDLLASEPTSKVCFLVRFLPLVGENLIADPRTNKFLI